MRRLASIIPCALSAAALAAPAAATAASERALSPALARQMSAAGRSSGAYVVNATSGRRVFSRRPGTPRMLASNTKLFTTSALLAVLGSQGRIDTEVRGDGTLGADGTFGGDLYLVGRGDPAFGSRTFTQRAFGRGASVQDLARKLRAIGIKTVSGRVLGDESRFDLRRGTPATGFGLSRDIGGPLSALAYNRGLANESGTAFQSAPAAFAAARLDGALGALGIPVSGRPGAATAPAAAPVLASVSSPTGANLIRLTNKPSDNYLAEMLLKELAFQRTGRGTTAGGATLAMRFAARLGSRVRMADGSGLARADRASPYRVARLLLAMRKRADYPAFFDSLSIAGRDGTLAPRMRRGPARGRCRGKTGTLSNVSALSGYCTARSGDVYVFSILMNGVNPFSARVLQDRMAQAIAGVTR